MGSTLKDLTVFSKKLEVPELFGRPTACTTECFRSLREGALEGLHQQHSEMLCLVLQNVSKCEFHVITGVNPYYYYQKLQTHQWTNCCTAESTEFRPVLPVPLRPHFRASDKKTRCICRVSNPQMKAEESQSQNQIHLEISKAESWFKASQIMHSHESLLQYDQLQCLKQQVLSVAHSNQKMQQTRVFWYARRRWLPNVKSREIFEAFSIFPSLACFIILSA